MGESVYSFFCGIRSRVVLPSAFGYSVLVCRSPSFSECYFSKFDTIFYNVFVQNGRKYEALYFNSVNLDLKFSFTLSFSNLSCSCWDCPSYFVGSFFASKDCWGKLTSKPPSTLTIPISSFPTFKFDFGGEECIGYPKGCCSDVKELFPFEGKANLVTVVLSLSKVNVFFDGIASLKKGSGILKASTFGIRCSSSSQDVFIEYSEDFVEFLLENYRRYRYSFPHILTFSKERKVKNLLLKIKSLLGG